MKQLNKIAIIGILVLHAVMMVLFNISEPTIAVLCLMVGGVGIVDFLLSLYQFGGKYTSRTRFGRNFFLYLLEKGGIMFCDIMMYQNCSPEGANTRIEVLGGMATFKVFCASAGMTMIGVAFLMFLIGMAKTKKKTAAA